MIQKKEPTVCPSCGASYTYGTLFCEECGECLAIGGMPQTKSASVDDQAIGRARLTTADVSSQVQKFLIEGQILNSGHAIQVWTDEEILLGRQDAEHNIFPQLDLTAAEGRELGVSRRHARIVVQEGKCFVEDLESMNGTYLNDEHLTPHTSYELTDGDILTLGTMRLQINLRAR